MVKSLVEERNDKWLTLLVPVGLRDWNGHIFAFEMGLIAHWLFLIMSYGHLSDGPGKTVCIYCPFMNFEDEDCLRWDQQISTSPYVHSL